jgi:hypothetical protein
MMRPPRARNFDQKVRYFIRDTDMIPYRMGSLGSPSSPRGTQGLPLKDGRCGEADHATWGFHAGQDDYPWANPCCQRGR